VTFNLKLREIETTLGEVIKVLVPLERFARKRKSGYRLTLQSRQNLQVVRERFDK
jgi:hypothetical protein